MNPLAGQLLGLAIKGLVSTMGIRAATAMLDETRKAMVRDQRGPTDEEIAALYDDINARSDRIQGA